MYQPVDHYIVRHDDPEPVIHVEHSLVIDFHRAGADTRIFHRGCWLERDDHYLEDIGIVHGILDAGTPPEIPVDAPGNECPFQPVYRFYLGMPGKYRIVNRRDERDDLVPGEPLVHRIIKHDVSRVFGHVFEREVLVSISHRTLGTLELVRHPGNANQFHQLPRFRAFHRDDDAAVATPRENHVSGH